MMQLLDEMLVRNNCKSRIELIEKSLKFYDEYIRSTKENEYLSIVLSSALNRIVKATEDRISRVLFKNAVELAMMMNVLSVTAKIDENTLKKLRSKCIRDVKGTHGKVNFEKVYKDQHIKKIVIYIILCGSVLLERRAYTWKIYREASFKETIQWNNLLEIQIRFIRR